MIAYQKPYLDDNQHQLALKDRVQHAYSQDSFRSLVSDHFDAHRVDPLGQYLLLRSWLHVAISEVESSLRQVFHVLYMIRSQELWKYDTDVRYDNYTSFTRSIGIQNDLTRLLKLQTPGLDEATVE